MFIREIIMYAILITQFMNSFKTLNEIFYDDDKNY